MSASVFFFGGYNASKNDIDGWVRSAKQQQPNMEFSGFPWPSGVSADDDSAVKGSKKSGQFKSAVDAIQACPADMIYIVGHSSGCAIANAVDKGLKNTSNVVLVSLDGFTPDVDQRKRSSTQVWNADCGHVKSKNWHKGLVGAKVHHVYHATDCKELWALHVVLVNANATDGTVTDVATGYANCQANLCWL
jgi:hypothetical protein